MAKKPLKKPMHCPQCSAEGKPAIPKYPCKHMKARKKKQTFILCGDIIRAGRVLVRAKDKDEAIRKAEAGDFQVHDETKRGASFVFDGGDEHIEKE